MANEWYYSHDGERHGPVPVEQIKEMAAAGRLRPTDLVWQTGMVEWTEAGKVPGLLPPLNSPPPIPPAGGSSPYAAGSPVLMPDMADVSSKKLVAGLCGIFFGAFGVHKFILGMTTPGLIMLLVSLCSALGGYFCFPLIAYVVMHAIGLVEGIIYLTKSDQEFYQTYIVGKKEWF